MKQPLLIFVLGVATFAFFYDPAQLSPKRAEVDSPSSNHKIATAHDVVVASAPASYTRWKTGPTAQNDWKLGRNAQTDFEPFAPSEQATWNQNSGYTIVSGARIRR